MSYGVAAALQEAIFSALQSDLALQAEISGAVFDAEPPGVLPDLYVSLGAETARARSDVTGPGAVHEFLVSVVSDAAGFSAAKTVAAMISDVLSDPDFSLSRGELVSCRFLKAKAGRDENGTTRRIDLTFRAQVDDA